MYILFSSEKKFRIFMLILTLFERLFFYPPFWFSNSLSWSFIQKVFFIRKEKYVWSIFPGLFFLATMWVSANFKIHQSPLPIVKRNLSSKISDQSNQSDHSDHNDQSEQIQTDVFALSSFPQLDSRPEFCFWSKPRILRDYCYWFISVSFCWSERSACARTLCMHARADDSGH